MKRPCVYILTNRSNTALYTGVTSNLIKRIYEHKEEVREGFTQKYNCNILVYFEFYQNMRTAIIREKQIKKTSREKKNSLINNMNPLWKDLYYEIIF